MKIKHIESCTHRIIESSRLEKTSKIIKSNHQHSTTMPAKLGAEVPHLHGFWTPPGMVAPSPLNNFYLIHLWHLWDTSLSLVFRLTVVGIYFVFCFFLQCLKKWYVMVPGKQQLFACSETEQPFFPSVFLWLQSLIQQPSLKALFLVVWYMNC